MQSLTPNGLVEYEPGMMADALMMHLFTCMCVDEEIDRLFHDVDCLSDFMRAINRPTQTVFKGDEHGIWFLAMYTPHFAGATFDMYVAPRRRKGKAWVSAMCEALEYGFEKWPVLIGLTAHENLLDDHVRMGYIIAGKIPGLWHGKDVHVLHITRESFNARETHLRRRTN